MRTGTDADFGAAVRTALCLATCDVDFWRVVERRDGEGEAAMPWLSAWRVAPWLVLAIVLAGGWWYVGHLHRARDALVAGQAATAQALANETAARQAVTDALVRANHTLAEREARQRVLERQHAERRGNLEQAIRAPEAQPWAAARLPADVYSSLRAAAAARHDEGSGSDTAANPVR